VDPTTPGCPHLQCPARGHGGASHMRLHSRKDPRFLCTECAKTCSATQGTALYRLRTAAATVPRVGTLLAHGCPPPALVAAVGCDERTVRRWMARGGGQGQAGQEHLVEPPRDRGPVHADALRVQTQGGSGWRALARMVPTRWWLGGAVSAQRALTLLRPLLERVRRGAAHRPLLVCTDGLGRSLRAMRETLRDPVHTGPGGRPPRRPWRPVFMAQGVQRYERRRVGAPDRRRIDGPPARVETRRRRSQGDGVSHTADMERWHATFRERLAPLARRCRALARHPRTWHEGLCLVGTVENFCPPHASRRCAGGATTPAMAAGITEHGWTVRARLSFPVPPPRWTPPTLLGRPSRVLKHLIARWCSS
jgi:transposase-like protein